MKPPSPIWETAYAHDRRNHRHRCRRCNRILNDGDAVIMARISNRQTLAIHAACGDFQHGNAVWTWRDAMTYWGLEHQKALGYNVDKQLAELAKLRQPR